MTDFTSIRPIPSIVNNEPLTAGKTYPVYRTDLPGKREVLYEVHACSVQDATKLVEAAHAAFPAWRATTFAQRREIFLKAASLLRERIPQLVQQAVEETSNPKNFSGFEHAVLAAGHLEEAAAALSAALKSEILPEGADGARKYVFYEPYGVVLGIAPWNAPFVLGLRSVLYAIAAGNTVVLKTSEMSPRVHLAMAQLLIDAGLPKGVLNVAHVAVEDAGPVVESIIAHKAVRKVNFTGSTRVGRIVAQVAAKYLKPTVMELGGKAPLIVLDDANLDIVANNILFGGYMNSNQICMSVNNVFVHSSLHNELQGKVAALMEANKAIFTAKAEQNFESPHAVRGLFNAASAERLKGLYDDAIAKGAQVLVGTAGFDGAVVQPIIVGPVNENMRIFKEETFGPVLSMITFDTIDQAVELANNNDMGLAAAVYGKDVERAFKVARRIESGQVHVNAQSVHDDPMMPHGGWKDSGYGRFNGFYGIREFLQTQGVTVQSGMEMPLTLL